MKPPLDPVSVRLFTTLARYARTVRRSELLALTALALSGYVLGRDADSRLDTAGV